MVADGYYEWEVAGKQKLPWRYQVDGGTPFLFAAVWGDWKDPEHGPLSTCAMVTTDANELAAKVHHRMPVILDPTGAAAWLDPSADPNALLALLAPFPADRMNAARVSPSMNNARNEGEEHASEIAV